MKKILFITEGHLPVPASLGGAIQTIMDSLISENEINREFQFSFISIYNENAFERSKKLESTDFTYIKPINCIRIMDNICNYLLGLIIKSRKNRKINFFWKTYYLSFCKKMLKENVYDIVILENAGYLTRIFNCNELLNKYENRIYLHLHNEIPNSVVVKNLSQMTTIVISNYLTQRIFEILGNQYSNKIRLLKNGIKIPTIQLDEKQRLKIRMAYDLDESDFVVIFVGRICEQKGVLKVLEAFKDINNKKDIKLLIVGGTEFGNEAKSTFEEEFRVKCDKLGKRVKVTGYIPHEEVWKYYQASDLAVLPSLWEEAAGLTVIEAMGNCIPIITTNCGGIPEYFEEKYGRMLNVDEYLIENIQNSILDIYENRAYWKHVCKDAFCFVKSNYSEQNYYSNFSEIINE